MNNETFASRMSAYANALSQRPLSNADAAKNIAQHMLVHLAASMSPGDMARMCQGGSLPRVITLLPILKLAAPEFIEELAEADLRAIAILLAERLFGPGELENILEGRIAERRMRE